MLPSLALGGCHARAARPEDHAAGERMSDQLIYASVKEALSAEKGLESSRISVEVVQGVVVLSGSVPDAKTKDLAAQIARGVRGIKGYVDLLQSP